MTKFGHYLLVRATDRSTLDVELRRVRSIVQQASGPVWVVLMGGHRSARLEQARKELGKARDGVHVHAPREINGETSPGPEDLRAALAEYLTETGFQIANRQVDRLQIHLSEDVPMPLFATVTQAASVLPDFSIRYGDQVHESQVPWEARRDRFQAPRPTGAAPRLIGSSAVLQTVIESIGRLAGRTEPVLILGEPGTETRTVAHQLHSESSRTGQFMPVNAAFLEEDQADSLLFGHAAGVYASKAPRQGRIREASHGTLFLDQAFELGPRVMGKLVRALAGVDRGEVVVEPLGSVEREVVPTRVVVGAHGDPRDDEGAGTRALDLYLSVAAGVIVVPPLRERLEDLEALARSVLGEDVEVDPGAFGVLRGHPWRGNVRELELVLRRARLQLDDGPLTAELAERSLRAAGFAGVGDALSLPCDLEHELKRIEVATMQAAQRAAEGHATEAGRLIGLGESAKNFNRKLQAARKRLDDLGDPRA